NGTFVNGRKVEVVDLADGDEIRAGHTRFTVKVESTPGMFGGPLVGIPGDTLTDFGMPPNWAAIRDKLAAQPDEEVPGSAAAPRGDDGQQVPGYKFVRELGRGSMGVVYLAT